MSATTILKRFRELPPWRRYRIAARLGVLAAAATLGFLFAFWIQIGRHGWAALAAVGLGLLSMIEFVLADLVIESRFPPETRDFLELLQAKLANTPTHETILRELGRCVERFRGCNKAKISSTVHLRVSVVSPSRDGTTAGLIQISDYTQAGLGGRRWRALEATKGIVGRCLRLEETVWVNFRSAEEYSRRMVEEFGFVQAELDTHTGSARSYLAHPLKNEGATVGVLYFFSQEPQVFPRAAEPSVLERTAERIVDLLRTAGIL